MPDGYDNQTDPSAEPEGSHSMHAAQTAVSIGKLSQDLAPGKHTDGNREPLTAVDSGRPLSAADAQDEFEQHTFQYGSSRSMTLVWLVLAIICIALAGIATAWIFHQKQ